jgi:hypothetical protein
MRRRYFGYGALFLFLLSLVLFLEASREKRYESTVSRVKGTAIRKEIRPLRLGHIYGVTYRVVIQGQTLEREGDVGSQKVWDSIRVGDAVDVESVGVTPSETRLVHERLAGSGVYFTIAAGLGIAGVVLLALRLRRSGASAGTPN